MKTVLRLNGWQRLWLILSVIYVSVATVIAVLAFPTSDRDLAQERLTGVVSLLAAYFDSTPQLREERNRRLDRAAFGGALNAADVDALEAEAARLTAEYRSRVNFFSVESRYRSGIQQHQLRFVVHALLALALPIIAAYVLGWSVGWVIRGFRKGDQ